MYPLQHCYVLLPRGHCKRASQETSPRDKPKREDISRDKVKNGIKKKDNTPEKAELRE